MGKASRRPCRRAVASAAQTGRRRSQRAEGGFHPRARCGVGRGAGTVASARAEGPRPYRRAVLVHVAREITRCERGQVDACQGAIGSSVVRCAVGRSGVACGGGLDGPATRQRDSDKSEGEEKATWTSHARCHRARRVPGDDRWNCKHPTVPCLDVAHRRDFSISVGSMDVQVVRWSVHQHPNSAHLPAFLSILSVVRELQRSPQCPRIA